MLSAVDGKFNQVTLHLDSARGKKFGCSVVFITLETKHGVVDRRLIARP